MSNLLRYIVSAGILGASLLGGWTLMQSITPDPEELVKRLPEADPVKMAETRRRTQDLVNALKAAAESPYHVDGFKNAKKE